MKYSPDLCTLRGFINAFPTLASVFEAAAAEILDAVATSTVSTWTQSLMQVVLQIRTGSFPAKDIEEVQRMAQQMTFPNQCHLYSPKLLVKFVGQAHTIHILSHACLDHYIQKTLSLQPSRFKIVKSLDQLKMLLPPRYESKHEYRVISEKYQIKNARLHSWDEEQLDIRTLWKMQVLFELKAAWIKGRLTHWPNDNKDLSSVMTPTDFWIYPGCLNCTHDALLTVHKFLETLKLQPLSHPFNLYFGPINNYKSSWLCSSPPAERVMLSGQSRSAGTICFQYMVMSYNTAMFCQPFCTLPPTWICKWDLKRLEDLGFLPEMNLISLQEHETQMTWHSILSEEELAEGERARKAKGINYLFPWF